MGEEVVSKIERQKTKKEIFASLAKKCTTLHVCPQGSATGSDQRTHREAKQRGMLRWGDRRELSP